MEAWNQWLSFPFSLHLLQIEKRRHDGRKSCTSFRCVTFETFSICSDPGSVPLLPFGFSVVPGSRERRTEGGGVNAGNWRTVQTNSDPFASMAPRSMWLPSWWSFMRWFRVSSLYKVGLIQSQFISCSSVDSWCMNEWMNHADFVPQFQKVLKESFWLKLLHESSISPKPCRVDELWSIQRVYDASARSQ